LERRVRFIPPRESGAGGLIGGYILRCYRGKSDPKEACTRKKKKKEGRKRERTHVRERRGVFTNNTRSEG